MPQIGWFEILTIVAISIIVIGPKDFPVVLKKIGSWIGSIKRYINKVQSEVSELNPDEIDLDKALNENYIFGAGLDVFNKDPPEENNPLLNNNKVFLSPHTATFTNECTERMGKETIQNIIDFFDEKLEKFKTVKL